MLSSALYPELLDKFWRMQRKLQLGQSEIALYMYLLYRCELEGWPDKFNLSNDTIKLALGVSEPTIKTARDQLIAAKLIDAKAGMGRGSITKYKLEGLSQARRLASDAVKVQTTGTTMVQQSGLMELDEMTEHVFLTNRGDAWPLPKRLYEDLARLYPAVDIDATLRAAAAWLVTNKERRKTAGGMPRFINTWLSKEQNRGGHYGNNTIGGKRGVPSLGELRDYATDIDNVAAGFGSMAGETGQTAAAHKAKLSDG